MWFFFKTDSVIETSWCQWRVLVCLESGFTDLRRKTQFTNQLSALKAFEILVASCLGNLFCFTCLLFSEKNNHKYRIGGLTCSSLSLVSSLLRLFFVPWLVHCFVPEAEFPTHRRGHSDQSAWRQVCPGLQSCSVVQAKPSRSHRDPDPELLPLSPELSSSPLP